ncbi:MAG TPA: protein-glutamate O-methyltransferase CheR, partial [bacterium]|nr:protein-glutamate O-methyltransferase CheR [bacterium]
GVVKLKKNIASMIAFERLNLIENFSFDNGFEVIFCRNVMIYFDSITRQNTVDKFYKVLNPGGYLIIGHSESLSGIQHSFHYIQPTIYRK